MTTLTMAISDTEISAVRFSLCVVAGDTSYSKSPKK